MTATILVDMAYQDPLDRLLNPDAEAPDAEQTDQRLDLAIALFLHGATGPGGPPDA
ncbi:hypothetical protein [Roseospira navarrensis]|uniref:Uncharacterized protein n=1 Tax=Roseospira navarrensis TaxID=140058 RepID=A0A7X1ZI99_9PROT|nr:hypothetical protein [Roseospira navarrensis]